MQDNAEQPKSLSQLLRESYLAEARANQQQHGRPDASSSRLRIYRSFKGKVEDPVGRNDPRPPDLSAFLSQEELDTSVNLARQAIVHRPHEERSEVTPSSPPSSASTRVPSEPSSVVNPARAPSALPVTRATPECKELPATQTNFPSDRRKPNATARQEDPIGRSQESQDINRAGRNVPYGPETQSKKEFLNKAADFIEELSSLFKANSSKRIRQRGCKSHRSRNQNKGQGDGAALPPRPEATEGPGPAAGHQTEVRLASGIGHVEVQDGGVTEEEQRDSVSQEAGKDAASRPPPPAEPESEPPHFTQKLRSRELPEGSKVQLDCIVRGRPAPEVRWFCEGKELENSPDLQIIADGALHSLVITEAFEEDTGRYSCFASNFYGTDSTSAEIYVEGASSSDSDGEQHFEHVARPQGTSPSPSGQAPATEVSSRPAEPSEDPAERLATLSTPEVIPDPPQPVRTSDAAAPELSKSFEEPATRPDREETTQTQTQETQDPSTVLPVAPAPIQASQPEVETPPPQSPRGQTSNRNHLRGLSSQPIAAAPVFTKSLQELLTAEGQLVVLECRVKGVPSPRVNWYREAQLIEDSPEFRILQKRPRSPSESEDICTLVIAEVLPEDSGMFTCTASSKLGTASCAATLRVRGNGNANGVRPVTSLTKEPPPPASTVNTQLEVTVTNSVEPHVSALRLDPLIAGTLRPDQLCNPKPSSSSTVIETSSEQEASRPSEDSTDASPKLKGTSAPQNGGPVVVPLPDPPPNSCLKSGGALTNHKDPRSSSRVGLHVHFKLPEDEEEEQSDTSAPSDEDATQVSANKGPPPVWAKPKLDPAQLQLLHHQVLMEQRQEGGPQTQTAIQPEVQSLRAEPLWSPRMHQEPPSAPLQSFPDTTVPPPREPPLPATAPASFLSSSSAVDALSTHLHASPAPPFSGPASTTRSLVTPPQRVPQPGAAPPLSIAPATWVNAIHAFHAGPPPAVPSRSEPTTNSSAPPALTPSAAPSEQITSPAPLLRSTHASLTNLTPTSRSFNYARPREFIAAQMFSPARSPPPTESPVPLLHALAAELNSPAPPLYSQPPRFFPTRVLKSPTSPPSLVSSPTPGLAAFLSSALFIRGQSPPQTSSPTSSSSTPSPIQNPVAFLSSVLPSLPLSPPTNSMGLPKGAPLGLKRQLPKTRLHSAEGAPESKASLFHDLEEKLRFTPHLAHQQKLSIAREAAGASHGPNIPASVVSYDEAYKVSSFEQRLMSEIEFRLERTPVEESDDEVQHDDVPTGKCIAPIFGRKLKHFRAMEGVPVTLSCKVVGIPVPKVYWFKDGKQIVRKNTRYKKMRDGDGICALHIESTSNDDDGNYTIMAANPQGRISCSGHLIVQTGPPRNQVAPVHSQRVRARIQEVESERTQERFFQPHFLEAPGDLLAHEGRLCRLDCKVSGLPSPELMWLVNGRPIYPDAHHKMLVRENGVHSLVIDPLTQRDAGIYACIASNKAGQSSFSLELKVAERELKHPPQFLEKLQNVGIPEGTPVRLECRVLGMPPPAIFWKKDNDTIPKTKDRFGMSQDATGRVRLLIQPTTRDDAGWYTVSAKNDAGIAACTCRLDIYAQWHQNLPAPMRRAQHAGGCYAALAGQGLDIKSESSPILFSSSPPEAVLESDEL
ncbi:myopalladin [Brachionichthys hirsutus]|uniref:myopalladin n=1 Tax=Brachionichthys hirsutus TaxID=412623 RepID=UPI0036046EF1